LRLARAGRGFAPTSPGSGPGKVSSTIGPGRSTIDGAALQKLEQAMYLFPDSVRSIITSRLPLDAAPDAVRQPHGVKDIVRVRAA
jgi:hypothetical protein